MSCPRVSYRRRMHYATRGNRMKLVRTPGNRLVMQKRVKRSQGVHTPWVLGHKRLGGTKAFHHLDARLESRHRKSVSRAYGGVLSHAQVRDRIVRAFLVEEQRVVKQALAAHAKYQRNKKRAVNKRKKKAAVTAAAVAKTSARTTGTASAAARTRPLAAGKLQATKKTSQPSRRQPVGAVLAGSAAAAPAAAAAAAAKAKAKGSNKSNNNNNNGSGSGRKGAGKASPSTSAARVPVGAKLTKK